MSRTPPGILAPISACDFGLEGEDRERLAALRAEKQAEMRQHVVGPELPTTKEPSPVIQQPTKSSPAFTMEFARSKPGPRPKDAPPLPTKGLDALTVAARRTYDEFQELAPGGCRPVRQAVVAARLGITPEAVRQHVLKMRAAGVFLDGWNAAFGGNKAIDARPKADPDAITPAEQAVLDVCERLAPGGSRPLRHEDIAAELGVTKSSVGHRVKSLRAKNAYRDEWVIEHGCKLARPKPAQPSAGVKVPQPAPPGPKPPASPAPPPPHADPPADSPAARSLAAHATKHRVTAEERRLREAHAERETPVACEVRAKVEPPPLSWRTRAIELHAAVHRVLEALPDDEGLAWSVLRGVEKLMAAEAGKAVSA